MEFTAPPRWQISAGLSVGVVSLVWVGMWVDGGSRLKVCIFAGELGRKRDGMG